MATYQELVAQAQPALRRLEARDRPRVAVAVDTSSIASGALETLAALKAEIERRGLDVDLVQAGGTGLSFADPVVQVTKPDGTRVLYQHVTAASVGDFVEGVFVKDDDHGRWVLGALHDSPGEHIPAMADHPWWSIQVRRLMRDMGDIDPENIDDALARGAYAGLERALGMSQEEVIAEVTGSKLLGRSGSFFPTGRKWDFLRTSPTTPKAMVCNADEGDPGAWVNRMIMENDPHSLIEGMIIGGWAAGAYHGYIYVREEYPLAYDRLLKAIAQAEAKGVLGENVLRHDFAFNLKIVRGAGSYVCGEESGLIASVEDARGMPKIRPPYPAASGVFGEGSNVNNVGSYQCAAWIMRHGAAEYASVGTERNPGTMMFTLSGDVQRVGCFELPFGVSVRDAFEACGGGPPLGRTMKGLQPGGPLLGVMPRSALDVALEPEAFREAKAVGLGGGGLVFLDDSACIVDLCAQFEWFLEDESCGRCTTCHGGTQRAVEIIRRIQKGGGRASDIGKIRLLADTLRYSNCFHGQFAPSVIVNAIDWFAEEFEEHIFDRHCRAGVCKGLIRYEIAPAPVRPEALEGLAKAADLCPTDAIVATGSVYAIDDALCIRCNACRDIAPEAVRVVPAFGPEAAIARDEPVAVTAAG